METKVTILIEGEIPKQIDESSWTKVGSTIILIQDRKNNIVIDPGFVKSPQIIENALRKAKLKYEDITYVFLTHSHIDHFASIGLFPNANHIDYWGIWKKEELNAPIWSDSVDFQKGNFSKNIQIVNTPGHDYSCLTFLVRGNINYRGRKINGTVAICGDLFWKEDYPTIEEEPFATDKKLLETNRKKILKVADYIIPGHGDIYKIRR